MYSSDHSSTVMGLSPRMRGNQTVVYMVAESVGPIPAYAGEPLSSLDFGEDNGAYPRVCGGTLQPGSPNCLCPGLSPRMRGNRPGAAGRSRF